VLKPLLMHTQWSSVYQQVSSIFSVSSKKRKIPRDAQRGCETRERCKSRVAATGRYHSSPPDTSGRDARAPGKARF
jgi:hypothetical protein